MFWRITGVSPASPVEAILNKEKYTLEDLLDEDEILQEYKALNSRLINFLRERTHVEQLLHYIVGGGKDDAEKKYNPKFPFFACEIITCEVDIILQTLVEDEDLMVLLFSFLKSACVHSTLPVAYFCKVVSCLILRKTAPLMKFVQAHLEIFPQLIDLIGVSSIMEVLIRLIGADEHTYSSYMDSMHWLEDSDILEMIVDKFSSSDSCEAHANVAKTLCAITRCSPSVLTTKILSPSFVGRLFHHALKGCRPKSVIVNSLSVCISLLEPKTPSAPPFHSFGATNRSVVTVMPDTVDAMVGYLGDLVKLLYTSPNTVLPTSFGSLQSPLGDLRLKIIEFISVLLTTSHEGAEKELIHLGALQQILNLFFEYPFNNFLHHHVERIISSCLTRMILLEHLFQDCDLVSKILEAEKSPILSSRLIKFTVPSAGKVPLRLGNIGHLTCLSNKLAQLAKSNNIIKMHLQEKSDWVDWYIDVLQERNRTENIYQWACGRPASMQDTNGDSDDEDSKDNAFGKAIFLCGDYHMFDSLEESNGSLEQDGMVNMSLEQDDESYFDDPADVFSSLNLGDDQESTSMITNRLALENDQANDKYTSISFSSSPTRSDDTDADFDDESDILRDEDGLPDGAMSLGLEEARDDSLKLESASTNSCISENKLVKLDKGSGQLLLSSEKLVWTSAETMFFVEERPEGHNNDRNKHSENRTDSFL